MRTLRTACKCWLFIAIWIGVGQSASAQTPPVTAYPYKFYQQGAAQPAVTGTLQATAFVCNQTKPTVTGTQANPTKVVFDDPTNAGKACIYTDTGTGPLFALPFGQTVYEATLAATNSAGTSPESARSNLFTRPGLAPSAPTGLLLVP